MLSRTLWTVLLVVGLVMVGGAEDDNSGFEQSGSNTIFDASKDSKGNVKLATIGESLEFDVNSDATSGTETEITLNFGQCEVIGSFTVIRGKPKLDIAGQTLNYPIKGQATSSGVKFSSANSTKSDVACSSSVFKEEAGANSTTNSVELKISAASTVPMNFVFKASIYKSIASAGLFSNLEPGQIAGIIAAAILAILVISAIIIMIVCCCRKGKDEKKNENEKQKTEGLGNQSYPISGVNSPFGGPSAPGTLTGVPLVSNQQAPLPQAPPAPPQAPPQASTPARAATPNQPPVPPGGHNFDPEPAYVNLPAFQHQGIQPLMGEGVAPRAPGN